MEGYRKSQRKVSSFEMRKIPNICGNLKVNIYWCTKINLNVFVFIEFYRLLRRLILSLAVNTHMKEAELKAQQLYLDFKQNGHKVPPDFRAFCYSTGIRLGETDDWNFAYKMYNETLIASERSLWMRALTASPHVYVLQQ